METKGKIKVIKRAERPVKPAKRAAKTKPANARDVVATVTDWVTEFQQRRREDARNAFDKLFVQTPDHAGCTNC